MIDQHLLFLNERTPEKVFSFLVIKVVPTSGAISKMLLSVVCLRLSVYYLCNTSDSFWAMQGETDVDVLPLHCILLLTKSGLHSLQSHVQDVIDSSLQADAVGQIQLLYKALSRSLLAQNVQCQWAACQTLIPALLECSAAFKSAGVFEGLPERQELLRILMWVLQ